MPPNKLLSQLPTINISLINYKVCFNYLPRDNKY